MHPYIVLASAILGLLVGMTGAGGGALMTPMLILLFGVKASTAIASDLVAAGCIALRCKPWQISGRKLVTTKRPYRPASMSLEGALLGCRLTAFQPKDRCG